MLIKERRKEIEKIVGTYERTEQGMYWPDMIKDCLSEIDRLTRIK